MPTALIGAGISAGGSILSGILGKSAAGSAAQAEQVAAQNAEAYQKQQTANSVAAQQNATTQQTANQTPFVAAGQQTVNSLAQMLQPGGTLTQGYGSFTAPTAAQAEQTPGYQFQLQQGEAALQNSAAARGGLLSTGTAKNLNNYAQGTAASNYQNVYNNSLNAYGANANTFFTNQNNLYNRLSGTSALGENAASNLNSNLQSGANNLGNIYNTSGQQIGNDILGAGQAQAAGIVGGNNALTNGISGAGNAISQGLTLQQLLGAQNASNTQGPMAGVNPASLTYGGASANLPADPNNPGYYQ